MKFEEVIKHVEDAIESGLYKKGTRLPSIREMSILRRVNKSTVIKAYEDLEKKHVIYSIPKSGYYVIGRYTINNGNRSFTDFSQVTPDERLLPYKEFSHCINRAIDIYKSELFTYGDPQGMHILRKALSKYLMTQEIYTKPENICITNGVHQGLSILCSMDFPNQKKKVLIEQPTYYEIYNILEFNRCEFVTVHRGINGLDMAEIERLFKEEDIKFFYTMSRFQNPLGTHLNFIQKKQLVKLASKYNVFIVEDDYLAEMGSMEKNYPLFYYDVDNVVIYLRSFSKTFMPGIRLGCTITRSELMKDFITAKKCYDLNTSTLSQGALELYISTGMYHSHIKKIKSVYEKKNKVFTEQLKYLDKENIFIKPEESSFIFWMDLHNSIDSSTLADKLLNRGIKVSDGKLFVRGNSGINGIRLSIAALSDEQIRHGIKTIYDAIAPFS